MKNFIHSAVLIILHEEDICIYLNIRQVPPLKFGVYDEATHNADFSTILLFPLTRNYFSQHCLLNTLIFVLPSVRDLIFTHITN
jgi:hypothetical protein